jgi:2-polyprenyl-3-methyl-5-hydroxy-6-metoxy-1,4-benzoquinol methylase
MFLYSKIGSVKNLKEKVKACPLCKSNDYEKIKDININDLIEMWKLRRGFNPISEIYNNEILERRKCKNCGLYYYNYHLPDSEQLYEKLETIKGYYPAYRPTYKIALDIIKEIKPKNLLEIGSGNGSFLEYIRDSSQTIIGNEYNAKAVEICKSKGLNIISYPIEKINEEFDVVCHHEVLEHVFNTITFIENNIRLLKKGGKLIIGTPDPESILIINGNGELHYPPHHQFDFSKKTFDWIAEEYNLKIYDYIKTEVEKRHYEKYIELTNDKINYEECKKKFTGHSHVIVFEKL